MNTTQDRRDTPFAEFTEHRTAQEISALLHHGHIIPVRLGITQEYVRQHFPGWTWNELMAVWRAAGIVIRTPGGIPDCDPRVRAVHFTDAERVHVEWAA
ncbi:hypothetical protein [Kytococcus sedentarius]|uniref:hypothetical protein n=1 Tax=Kytococcus sedentarius TaxID=1276 RepID=UPI0035BC4F70